MIKFTLFLREREEGGREGERERERERERKRETRGQRQREKHRCQRGTSISSLSHTPQPGTEPAT